MDDFELGRLVQRVEDMGRACSEGMAARGREIAELRQQLDQDERERRRSRQAMWVAVIAAVATVIAAVAKVVAG